MTWTQDDPSLFASLPAGTTFKWQEWAEAPEESKWKELKNVKSLGAMGNARNYIDVTCLNNTRAHTMAGLPELTDVSWGFVYADEKDFTDFLDEAEKDTRVSIQVIFPKKIGKKCVGDFYLSGFSMDEPDPTAAQTVTVNARQANLEWSADATGVTKSDTDDS